MYIVADSLDDLLLRVYTRIRRSGSEVTASRGPTLELPAVLLRLNNPRARLSHTETKGKVFSAIGELLWHLSGRNDLDFIEYYLPRYRNDAEADNTLHGAYGPRLLYRHGCNQLRTVVSLLRKKPSSRRAVIQLFDSADLLGTFKEIPCTCTLQLLLRSNCLDLVVSMRSNDAYFGLPHDVFCFTMIQELLCRDIGCELGTYAHFVGSLHVYTDKLEQIDAYTREGLQPMVNGGMPPMPPGEQWTAIGTILELESDIRSGRSVSTRLAALPVYWQDMVRLLLVHRHAKSSDYKAMSDLKKKMANRVYLQYIASKQRKAPRTQQAPQKAFPFVREAINGRNGDE